MSGVLRVAAQLAQPVRSLGVPNPGSASAEERTAHARLLDLGAAARDAAAVRARALATLASVETALGQIAVQIDARLDQLQALVIELGLGVAEEVVGAAVDTGRADVTAAVRRCLDDLVIGPGDAQVVVRLHPEDLAEVLPWIEDEVRARVAVRGGPQLSFEPDAGLWRGSARVDTDAGQLRYQVDEVLAAMAQAIRAAVATPTSTSTPTPTTGGASA